MTSMKRLLSRQWAAPVKSDQERKNLPGLPAFKYAPFRHGISSVPAQSGGSGRVEGDLLAESIDRAGACALAPIRLGFPSGLNRYTGDSLS